MSINAKRFYSVDGILLEDEHGENFSRIMNIKEREKKSLDDFQKEEDARRKTNDKYSVLYDRQVCKNSRYFY